jgi:hypothetical protein
LKIYEKSTVSGVLDKPETRFKTIYSRDFNSAAPASKAISKFGMFQMYQAAHLTSVVYLAVVHCK